MVLLRFLISVAIPAITAYLASDAAAFDWLIQQNLLSSNIDVADIQRICLIINIVFTIVLLEARLEYHIHREDQCRKELAGLYNVIKQFAQTNFVSISNNDDFSFDLRIFVPEVNVYRWIKSGGKEKYLVIQNIEPFAKKDITENLRFMVEPDQQGLVGNVYHEGAIYYDDKLPVTNSTNYALGQSQLNRTSKLRWSFCVPIFGKNNQVIAVMAFDSDTSDLDIEGNKDAVKALTLTLATMMGDTVPELFKRKWSLF